MNLDTSQFLRSSANPDNVFFRCVEDCNEAIMITDVSGTLIYVNQAWESIYGYSREEATGQTPKLIQSGTHPAEYYRQMWEEIRDPYIGFWKGNVLNRAKDGRIVPVLLSITPFRSEADAAIKGYLGIALDTSSQKELEAKVLHQDRLASVGILASGLAHEIGTPLGIIRGRAEMLQSSNPDNPQLTTSLVSIISQIDRISDLINSLLRYSRANPQTEFTSLLVKDSLDDVLKLLAHHFKRDGVEIDLRLPEQLRVRGNANFLQQIFLNLAVNALDAIQTAAANGRKTGHRISIASTSTVDEVTITFTDTGCGIHESNIKLLFQPFYTTKEVGKGTGLGLAIVYNLATEMGGTVSCTSVLGKGATFTVQLPRAGYQ